MKKKLRILALLCALAVLMGVSVLAESTPIDTGNGWSYTLEDGELHIYGGSDSLTYLPLTHEQLQSVTSVVFEPGFTEVILGFDSCVNLTTLVFSDTVTYVDNRAFSKCAKLTDVTIPASVTRLGSVIPGDFTNSSYDMFYAVTDKSQLTIHGYENSWAKDYAERYGANFDSLGFAEQKEVLITHDQSLEGQENVIYIPEPESEYDRDNFRASHNAISGAITDNACVKFDDGVFWTDGWLSIREKRNVTLCAKDPGKTEILSYDGDHEVLSIAGSAYVTVEGLLMGHRSTSTSGGCSGNELTGAHVIYGSGSHDVTVDNCDLWGCGIIATDFINCHDIIVKNSVLRDCILCAVYASGSNNISYTDCVISGNWKNATNVTDSPCVKLSGDNSVSFERCTFMNNNNYLLLPEDETLAAQVSMKDCTFLNNVWQDETPATCGICYAGGITWEIEATEQYGYYNLYLGRGLTFADGTTIESGKDEDEGEVPVYSKYSIPWEKWDSEYNYHEKLNVILSDGVTIPWHYFHNWGEPELEREANCGYDSRVKIACTECDVIKYEYPDPATGLHVWDEGVKREGYTLYTCTVCGRTKQDDISGSCGMQGDNLQWLLHDGTLTISGEGEMMDNASWKVWEIYANQINKVVVEEGVTTLGFVAFQNFRSLTEVELPDSLTEIGAYAFSGCSSLTEITIPESVTYISFNAFDRCESLTDVYFLGSEEQWNEVEKQNGNDPLLNATIHFGAAVKVGDASGDGEVNAKDGIVLARALAGWTGYEIDLASMDVNSDGVVTAKDNIVLARHLASWTGYEVLPLPKS